MEFLSPEDGRIPGSRLTRGIVMSLSRAFYPLLSTDSFLGEQWLSGRVLDSRQRGRGFETHRRHCVVVLEQDTFILA